MTSQNLTFKELFWVSISDDVEKVKFNFLKEIKFFACPKSIGMYVVNSSRELQVSLDFNYVQRGLYTERLFDKCRMILIRPRHDLLTNMVNFHRA